MEQATNITSGINAKSQNFKLILMIKVLASHRGMVSFHPVSTLHVMLYCYLLSMRVHLTYQMRIEL